MKKKLTYEEKRKLAWKYFWQQKWEESRGFVFSISLFGIWIFWMCTLFFSGFNGFSIYYWQTWCSFAPIIIFLTILIYQLLWSFYEWLSENWQRAKKRAGLK